MYAAFELRCQPLPEVSEEEVIRFQVGEEIPWDLDVSIKQILEKMFSRG